MTKRVRNLLYRNWKKVEGQQISSLLLILTDCQTKIVHSKIYNVALRPFTNKPNSPDFELFPNLKRFSRRLQLE